jgi:hypothetical protein
MLPVEILAFLQGLDEEESFRITTNKPLVPDACLDTDTEMKVVSHIQLMQAAGFTLSRKDVQISPLN